MRARALPYERSFLACTSVNCCATDERAQELPCVLGAKLVRELHVDGFREDPTAVVEPYGPPELRRAPGAPLPVDPARLRFDQILLVEVARELGDVRRARTSSRSG